MGGEVGGKGTRVRRRGRGWLGTWWAFRGASGAGWLARKASKWTPATEAHASVRGRRGLTGGGVEDDRCIARLEGLAAHGGTRNKGKGHGVRAGVPRAGGVWGRRGAAEAGAEPSAAATESSAAAQGSDFAPAGPHLQRSSQYHWLPSFWVIICGAVLSQPAMPRPAPLRTSTVPSQRMTAGRGVEGELGGRSAGW